MSYPLNEATLPPPLMETLPSIPFVANSFDLFVPEFSLWNNAKSPPFWRSQDGTNTTPAPPVIPAPFKLDESHHANPLEHPRSGPRPNFSLSTNFVFNRDKAAMDPNFFEECFSPKRTRRLSIDSDESIEVTNKKRLAEDEDDETKDIFKGNLNNSGILKMKPMDNGRPDFLYESGRSLSRQDSDPKEKLSMSELSNPIQLPCQTGMSQFKVYNEKSAVHNAPFFKYKPTSPNRSQKTENITKSSTPSQSLLVNYEKAFGKNIPKAKPLSREMGQVPQLSSPKLARPATVARKQSQDQKNPDPPKPAQNSNNPGRKSSREMTAEANDGLKCTCKKSKCLKLYCECFASQRVCSGHCNCLDCFNKEEYKDLRSYFLQDTLEKNPNAFKSKFKKIDADNLTLHTRGCNCKKTGCQKRYCECFSANTKCTVLCKCSECLNFCTESKEIEVEKYHERVLRKRKRKTRTFVQSLLERLKDVKPQPASSEQQE